MNLTDELTQAFMDHEEHTGNKPSKLRIHEELWHNLKKEFEVSGALRATDENIKGDSLKFRGASVTIVKSDEDPKGFFRWSIQ